MVTWRYLRVTCKHGFTLLLSASRFQRICLRDGIRSQAARLASLILKVTLPARAAA